MEFLKKHWQKLLIGLFVVLFFSTCASNCSNKNKIRTMKIEYAASDSVISALKSDCVSLNDSIRELKHDIVSLQKENSLYRKQVDDLNKALERKVVVNIKSNDE